MIKVLPRGANDPAAVRKHLDYIRGNGELDIEADAAIAAVAKTLYDPAGKTRWQNCPRISFRWSKASLAGGSGTSNISG
jgi:hypothetical protein